MAGKFIKCDDVQLLATEDRAIRVRKTLNKETVPQITVDAGWASVSPRATISDFHNKDEIYFIKGGEARIVLDGTETLAGSGDTVYIPAGCEHRIINDSDDPFELFWLLS